MKILIIGQGGREHAFVKALAQSPSVTQIHVVPGNDGMAREALCHSLDWRDSEAIIQFCLRTEIDVVILGPEDPAVEGLGDRLRERGILVFGAGRDAAQLEGSKIFAKNFLNEGGIPTARAVVVDSVAAVQQAMGDFQPPYVLKADGLCAGKGVVIAKTREELLDAAGDFFERETLGPAGRRALLEEFQPGWEMSYFVLTNGEQWKALPVAQDHKRLGDGDEGPNTGGMGTIAPVPLDAALKARIDREIVDPTVALIRQKGFVYRGVIFIGLMVTADGPKVIEYNVRFGDPETQVLLPLVDGDWATIFSEVAKGRLPELDFKRLSACCVILASPGYPAKARSVPITGNVAPTSPNGYMVHAGTQKTAEGTWITKGGRVLGAVGFGSSPREAVRHAYEISESAHWEGLQKRGDIGQRLIDQLGF